MKVGVLALELYLPGCRSLKEKRRVLKSLLTKLKRKFNVSLAEVDHHQLWQRTTIGLAYISITAKEIQKILSVVEKEIENGPLEIVKRETHIFSPE